jgi:hypothetical protein
VDAPKSLRNPEVREARLAALALPHVAPLVTFVHGLRVRMGPSYSIPYFDPLDGGVEAECLFLLEAPGPRAITSGFVSRNNPDETAKNFFLLNQEAGIDRKSTVSWNIVPWYLGTGKQIRAASAKDIHTAQPSLEELFALLPRLRFVVLVGKKAAMAESNIRSLAPAAEVFAIPHPSPMFVNRAAGNRWLILSALEKLAHAMQ